MSMLKPARNRMAFAKVGLYGTAGSGKTYTAAKIAIGLHQYTKSTKPYTAKIRIDYTITDSTFNSKDFVIINI